MTPGFAWPGLLMLCLGASVHAQTFSAPRLLGINPPGAKLGSEGSVEISGQGLEGIQSLRFSHPAIRATAKGSNQFLLSIASEVPPGIYDVRVIGTNGMSNPRAFAVGLLEEAAEGKNSSDRPQSIALGSTINGRAEANTVDYFRFEARAGQRVLVRCDSRAIDSKLEPVLTLYDRVGREVGRSRSGGLLDYTAEAGGEFTVHLHDATYRGGAEFFYRLSVGTFPHIDYVLPLASGDKARFAVFGRNLPGGKVIDSKAQPRLERMEIELAENDPALGRGLVTMPAQAALDLLEYRVRNEAGSSQPVPLRFPAGPVVGEEEPNNTPAAARAITPPCEVAGQFQAGGDRDWFRFEAKKGDVYWLEILSHRLGAPTDPMLLVQRGTTNGLSDVLELNDSEANFGGAEFNTAHRDPSGKLEIKEDGTYFIQLRDLFSHGQRSPGMIYQLILRKPSPGFRLAALPASALPAKKDAKDVGVTSAALRRGETLPVKVVAFRRDGFDGEIAVTADLPPGVMAAPCRMERGKGAALLFLTAAEDAAASNATIVVRGLATVAGAEVTSTAAPITVVWGTADPAVEPVLARAAANGALSISEGVVPVRVHPSSNVINSVTGRTVKVNFLIDRQESFAGGVKLKPFGLAALDSVPELDVDAKATNLMLQIDLREKKVPAGTHVFSLQVSPQAKAPADSGKKPKDPPPAFYSEPVVLEVRPGAPPTNSPAK